MFAEGKTPGFYKQSLRSWLPGKSDQDCTGSDEIPTYVVRQVMGSIIVNKFIFCFFYFHYNECMYFPHPFEVKIKKRAGQLHSIYKKTKKHTANILFVYYKKLYQ